MASPSPAPKPHPQAMQCDSSPRGGDSAGASPTGSLSPRSPPTAPTHALLTAHSFIRYTPFCMHRSPLCLEVPTTHLPWHQFGSLI